MSATDVLPLWHLPLPHNCFPHLLDSCFTSSWMQHTKPQSISISNLLSTFCSLIRQKEAKLKLMYAHVQGLEYWLSWETSHTLPTKIIYNNYQDLTQLAACQLPSQLFKDQTNRIPGCCFRSRLLAQRVPADDTRMSRGWCVSHWRPCAPQHCRSWFSSGL